MCKQLNDKIIIENNYLRLVIGKNAVAESLIFKPTGEECLDKDELLPAFSLTEDRPYNNEIKLAHPNKRTLFNANRVRLEGNKLIIGFELVLFEAMIEVTEAPSYVTFKLVDFIVKPEDFEGLAMTPPPVAEFRLLQLPVLNRTKFGEWLNVSFDDGIAVNLLANSPYARIDSFKRKKCRIMSADAVREIKMQGCSASLIVSPTDKLLDCIDALEVDYGLPRGVQSRRSGKLNNSTYWTNCTTPENVDEYIALAKKFGLKMMLLYYPCFFKSDAYQYLGDYDYRDEYPNGVEDVKRMLDKIKAAGITPGIHVLQTHIGLKSRLVTPFADHRLNLTRHFTLAKPLGKDDDVIYVEENPEGTVMYDKCRVLKFSGELIHFTDYTTEYPYCFRGCSRGHLGTNVITHELGQIGGILDISEFGARSCYLNQNSSLQDEIADKIAEVYNAGMEFVYFDGSEGAQPPFDFHVSNAQYRVIKKFDHPTIYCEGAAKSHFGWHFMSGGNAFDVFPAKVFKEKIVEFPFEEAPRMAQDFTRLNFGWWSYQKNFMPDMYEFGTSLAAAWDCPMTIMLYDRERIASNPRTEDNMQVIRRWEEYRHMLTAEQKEMLKDSSTEHILIVNEDKEYELLPYYCVRGASAGEETEFTAYCFERKGRTYVVTWHTTGEGMLNIPLSADDVVYENEIGGEQIAFEKTSDGISIPVAGRRYLSTALPKDEVVSAFKKAELV